LVLGGAILLAGLSALGCKPIAAPPSDYAAYRATRVGPTVASRLRAASEYLERYPEGAFHYEVAQWFTQIEPLFYEASADSASGMQMYLDALPRGPHAAAAADRRDALRAAQKSRSGERLSRAGALFEQRLARAAERRADVVAAYSAWIARLLELDAWRLPPEAAGESFSTAWWGDPRPTCTRGICSKIEAYPYELEIEGKLESFVCALEIKLRIQRGVVVEAEVGGPDLLARLFEAHQARPVEPHDVRDREAALGWLVELTSGAAARKLDPHRCAVMPVPPAMLVRHCDGVRLEIIAGTGPKFPDRVVIRGVGRL
jgi:hypothetical protein